MLDRELRAIAAKAAQLDLRREYQPRVEPVCRACGGPIGHVDALVYAQTKIATHATYPCTRRWLAFRPHA